MTRNKLVELTQQALSERHGDRYDATDLSEFIAGQINDGLDRAINELYFCQADRCTHCDEKIRKIEALKI
jgi:hypothetical protein